MNEATKQASPQSANVTALEVNPRVSLLTLSTVRALRGCSPEKIKREVESGKILWAFDFTISSNAPDTKSQCLRFWFIELLQRPGIRLMSPEEVIGQILPPGRLSYTTGEFCVKFSMNKAQLAALRWKLKWGQGPVRRDCLARFLDERWIGRAE